VIALLAIAAAPLILGVLTIGVSDRDVASDQLESGWLLMAMTMPQLPLYGAAIIGGAVMNAHGRYRLAAFAPVAENAGVIATMLLVGVLYGTGADLDTVSTGELLLLGLGSTAGVVMHAGLMLWGARRVGPRMRPRRGWRIPTVRRLQRRLTASIAQTGLTSLRFFAMLTVSNTVPGGVVAFRLAVNFLYLPVQTGAQPVTLTMLPSLARLHASGDAQTFRDECTRGLALVCFLALPSAIAYLVLARPLADAVSFGAMSGSSGPELVAASLTGIALAVIADSSFQLFTNASYARHDARSPLVATAAGTVLTLACLPIAFALDGSATLLVIGLAYSLGSCVAAWWIHRRLDAQLPPPQHTATRSLARTLAASLLMAGPAYFGSVVVARFVAGPVGAALSLLVGAALGIATFVAVQRRWHSTELGFFEGGLRRLSRRSA
jgi:putative peptidoglycan lipid II flippase